MTCDKLEMLCMFLSLLLPMRSMIMTAVSHPLLCVCGWVCVCLHLHVDDVTCTVCPCLCALIFMHGCVDVGDIVTRL